MRMSVGRCPTPSWLGCRARLQASRHRRPTMQRSERERERGGGVVVKSHGFDSSEEWASSSLDSRGFLGQKPPGAPQGSVLGLFHICSL